MSMTARVALTYQDYAALPDDGKRYEIHDGELSLMTAPTSDHQIVSVRLLRALDRHIEARGLGLVLHAPLDVILSDTAAETTIVRRTSSISTVSGSPRCTDAAWRVRRRWSSKSSRQRRPPPIAAGSGRSTRAMTCPASGSSTRTRASS